MKISIVSSLYNSAPYLSEFYQRCKTSITQITTDFEIILVNDGSPDESLDIALKLFERDKSIKVIDFSRNFGHHKAMMTGLEHADGDLIFLLDCDLEEEPENLNRFYDEMTLTGADVVYGIQDKRKGKWFERTSGYIYFNLMNLLSDYPLPRNLITSRLMTRQYVQNLIRHKEREVFIAGLWAITGFHQVPLLVEKHSRSESTYSLSRKLTVLVNSITSFSNMPLVSIFYIGLLITTSSSIYGIYTIIQKFIYNTVPSGWSSLIVSIWFLGGITIFCIGVIGIYLSKIYTEAKGRPYTIIRDVYEHRNEG
jgi:putative glycosyltransferase